MIGKAKEQRMQLEPGTIPPGGLMMDNCLPSMPVPSLIFISVAMSFWPFTDRNLGYRI